MKKLILVSTVLFFLLSISAIFAYSLNPSLDITYPIKKLAIWFLNLFGINTEFIEPMVGGCPSGQICCSDMTDCSDSACWSGSSQGQCSSVYHIYSCSNCVAPTTSTTSSIITTTTTSTITTTTSTTTITSVCCCGEPDYTCCIGNCWTQAPPCNTMNSHVSNMACCLSTPCPTTTTIYNVPSSSTTSSTTSTTILTTTTTVILCPPQYCDYLFSMVKGKYNSKCGDSNYDPVADVDKDGKIGLADLSKVSSYCGSDGTWCMQRIVDNTDPCIGTTSSVSTTTTYKVPSSTTTSSTTSTTILTTTTIVCSPESCNNLYTIVKKGYGKGCGDNEYDFRADLDKNGKISLYDLNTISSNCGNGNWCQSKLNDLTDPCPTIIQNLTTSSSTTTTILCVQSCQDLLDRTKKGYGSKCGDSNYNPVADVDKNGNINLTDLYAVSSNCGNGNWCQSKLNDLTDPCMSCPPASCQNLLDMLNAAYRSDCNSINYNPVADVDKNKKVDLTDLASVVNSCGNGNWCQSKLNNLTDPCVNSNILPSSTTTTILCVQSCQDLLDRTKKGFGSKCGDSNYDPVADVDKNKKVDLIDVASVDINCGNGNWCQSKLNDLTDPCMSCPPASCQNLLDMLNAAYGSDCNSYKYNPVADVDKNKNINLSDLKTVASHCGDGSWCENQLSSKSNPCMSMTELIGKCLNTCSKKYPLFWCRFSCNFACGIGFC
jgi:hypothetical protein